MLDGDCTYENADHLRIQYEDGAQFVRVCEKCGRFVKANPYVLVSEGTGLSPEPNALCAHCGPTRMLFEGFI